MNAQQQNCGDTPGRTVRHVFRPPLQGCRTRVYLVRHGELITSDEWRYVGQRDVALNDCGREQIRRLALRLQAEPVQAVFCSDLSRTRESAALLAAPFNVQPVADAAFREIDLGVWEGLTLEEIIERYGAQYRERCAAVGGYRVAGGESFCDVRDRAVPCLERCVARCRGQTVIIVAHGGTNRVLLAHCLGMPLDNLVRIEQQYACVNIIDFYDGGPVVVCMNDTGRVTKGEADSCSRPAS